MGKIRKTLHSIKTVATWNELKTTETINYQQIQKSSQIDEVTFKWCSNCHGPLTTPPQWGKLKGGALCVGSLQNNDVLYQWAPADRHFSLHYCVPHSTLTRGALSVQCGSTIPQYSRIFMFLPWLLGTTWPFANFKGHFYSMYLSSVQWYKLLILHCLCLSTLFVRCTYLLTAYVFERSVFWWIYLVPIVNL